MPVLEVKFERGDTDFSTQLRMLQNAHVDGVVIWAEVPDAAKILKQMRAMGMKQPVFGPSRLCYPQIIEAAGPAAEGLVTTSAIDPTRTDHGLAAIPEKTIARGFTKSRMLTPLTPSTGSTSCSPPSKKPD